MKPELEKMDAIGEYLSRQLKTKLANALLTVKEAGNNKNLKDPVLSAWSIDYVHHTIERAILSLFEIVKMHHPAKIKLTGTRYTDLYVLRNNCVAHRNEAYYEATRDYTKWYNDKFESREAIITFLDKERESILDLMIPSINRTIDEHVASGKELEPRGVTVEYAFHNGQISKLLDNLGS